MKRLSGLALTLPFGETYYDASGSTTSERPREPGRYRKRSQPKDRSGKACCGAMLNGGSHAAYSVTILAIAACKASSFFANSSCPLIS